MFHDPTGRFQILSGAYERIYASFEQSGYSTENLSPEDKTFLLVYLADSAINSDGIYSLWFNHHGLLDTSDVPIAYRMIGASEPAEIIEKFVRIAGAIEANKDIEKRALQMESLGADWPDDSELSGDYYASAQNIDDLLISYLQQTKPGSNHRG